MAAEVMGAAPGISYRLGAHAPRGASSHAGAPGRRGYASLYTERDQQVVRPPAYAEDSARGTYLDAARRLYSGREASASLSPPTWSSTSPPNAVQVLGGYG